MVIKRAPFKGCQLLPPTKSGFVQGHGLQKNRLLEDKCSIPEKLINNFPP